MQGQAYGVNSTTFGENVEDLKAGQTMLQLLWEHFVVALGKLFALDSNLERLRCAPLGAFRAITVEFLLGCENWSRATNESGMKMSAQRLTDTFHLPVALPYVDYVVSRDGAFVGLAKAIEGLTPFSLAPVLPSLKNAS